MNAAIYESDLVDPRPCSLPPLGLSFHRPVLAVSYDCYWMENNEILKEAIKCALEDEGIKQ